MVIGVILFLIAQDNVQMVLIVFFLFSVLRMVRRIINTHDNLAIFVFKNSFLVADTSSNNDLSELLILHEFLVQLPYHYP